MTVSSGFLRAIEELFAASGTVGVRKMFGAAGIYVDGRHVAIVDDDTLYLRTDAAGSPAFAAEGSEPFRYRAKNRHVTVGSYWRAPDRLLDDPDEMHAWVARAMAVAARAGAQRSSPAAATRRRRNR